MGYGNCLKKNKTKMVAEAEVVCQQRVPVLDVPYFGKGSNIEEIDEIVAISSPISSPKLGKVGLPADLPTPQLVSLSLSVPPPFVKILNFVH